MPDLTWATFWRRGSGLFVKIRCRGFLVCQRRRQVGFVLVFEWCCLGRYAVRPARFLNVLSFSSRILHEHNCKLASLELRASASYSPFHALTNSFRRLLGPCWLPRQFGCSVMQKAEETATSAVIWTFNGSYEQSTNW